MPAVYNRHHDDVPDGCVDITRQGGEWGNPYRVGIDGNRTQVLVKYDAYLTGDEALMARARRELRGRNLVCVCKPLACHGDVLLEIANS